jgi:soluble lytic murein transglycosylase-like protein
LADAIIETHKRYGMPIEIQLALIKRESNFEKYELGQAGELGFYQIMTRPHAGRVFRMMETAEITTKNLYDPHTQAAIGGSIFKECMQKRKHNMGNALACYNGTQSAGDYSQTILATAKAIKQSI